MLHSSLPLRLLLSFFGNVLLVWIMALILSQYFFLSGGLAGYVTVGALLTLLNLSLRPILHLVTLPLKLLAGILALVIVNGVFVWITEEIIFRMDPGTVAMQILGGLGGWIVVALWFGLGNWVMKMVLK